MKTNPAARKLVASLATARALAPLATLAPFAFALACSSASSPATPTGVAAGAAPQGGGSGSSVGPSGGVGGSGGVAGSAASGAGGSSAGAGGAQGGGGSGGAPPCAFGTDEHFIWPGAAPLGSTQAIEQFIERSSDPTKPDRSVTGVSRPSLFPYLAAKPNGTAAIVMPGGGYAQLAFDKEGVDIAEWLNSLGVSAFVLKYRLPKDFPGAPEIPLADAQRALRLVRKNAAPCAIDPARIGVIGFSAGGHLASQLATRFAATTAPAQDDIDAVDARPAFAVLMYPVISMDAAITHAGSRNALLGAAASPADVALYSSELQVTGQTPPAFLAGSEQDKTVNPQNWLRFGEALKVAGIAHELHRYADGAHGTGIRNASGDMADWPSQCAAWLTTSLFLGVP